MKSTISIIVLSVGIFLGVTSSVTVAFESSPFLGPIADIRDPDGGGSGFFTDPTHIVTARHVADQLRGSAHGNYVFDSTGKRHRVVNIQDSYDADVSMLEVDQPNENQPVAQVSCRMPNVLETLLAVGNPLNLKNIVSPVMVVGVNEDRDLDDVVSVVVVGAIAPGMSGGPLYDQTGKVVAIVSNTLNFQQEGDKQSQNSGFGGIVPLIAVPELCVAVPTPQITDEPAPTEEAPKESETP